MTDTSRKEGSETQANGADVESRAGAAENRSTAGEIKVDATAQTASSSPAAIGSRAKQIRCPEAVTQLDPEYQAFADELYEAGTAARKIAILYSRGKVGDPEPTTDEFVATDKTALETLGHEVTIHGLDFDDYRTVIRDLDASFVFNNCEGTGIDPEPSTEIILELERLLLPFSGAGSGPFALTNDKYWMKVALESWRVPVPAGTVMGHPDVEVDPQLRYPMFVKPRFGWGSVGVDTKSLVHNIGELRAAVARVVELTGLDALVEEYIDGRELTVGILGGGTRVAVLPPLEVEFGKAYENIPQVRMYDTKQNHESPLYWDFGIQCPARLSPELLTRVKQVALKAYQAVSADGYGRVDMRLAADGTPYVLEVNVNPSLETGDHLQDCGMFVLASRALGWDYPKTLAHIVGAGLLREVRRYRAPRLLMGNRNGLEPYSFFSIRRGALVAPLGPLRAPARELRGDQIHLSTSGGVELFSDPHVRFMKHSETPNLQLQVSRNRLWLAASRPIKAGELLTIDRHKLLSGFEHFAEVQRAIPRTVANSDRDLGDADSRRRNVRRVKRV